MSKHLKVIIGVVLGGVAGFAYYFFWGCKNGCPLQSNWTIMTGYGAFAGFVLTFTTKKKTEK
jgi:hypothetical protein